MSQLLLAFAFAGAFSSGPDLSIAVVADGTPGWEEQQADKILGKLGALLCASRPLQLAWFDWEPAPPQGFAVRSANHQLIRVTPRTPMREVMEIGLAKLAHTPGPRVMVVIAREQFYPTSVAIDQILQQARLASTSIYAIHLASGYGQAHGTRRAAHSAGRLFSRTCETLVIREHAYSERDTLLQLQLLSETTGGWVCQARDENTALACAAEVASRIEER